MCVGYWSLDHPDYSLVLCTNRDEYLSRPTAPAHFHAFGAVTDDSSDRDHLDVLSGRDLVAGGTWLGLTRSGRVGLLTNITEPYSTFPTSRGHLIQDFLKAKGADDSLPQALGRLEARNSEPYAGFNMLLLDPEKLPSTGTINYVGAFVTNHGAAGVITSRPLSSPECRCGGLSNGIDGRGADSWPKVLIGMAALDDAVHGKKLEETDLVERLFELLRWKSVSPPEERSQLRNTILIDPIRLGSKSSSASTGPEYYGTRLSTVILISRTGHATFIERDMWILNNLNEPVTADAREQRQFDFDLQPDAELPE